MSNSVVQVGRSPPRKHLKHISLTRGTEINHHQLSLGGSLEKDAIDLPEGLGLQDGTTSQGHDGGRRSEGRVRVESRSIDLFFAFAGNL